MTANMTPAQARYSLRNARDRGTRKQLTLWLREYQRIRGMVRRGEDVRRADLIWFRLQQQAPARPKDYGRHVHSWHQWVIDGQFECDGCGLRVNEEQVAA